MKKIFFSLLAIAAIASCAKTEAVYTEADSDIKLAPVASMVTKAEVFNAIEGTTYPADEHFTVIGYWANEPAGSTFATGSTYLDAVDFAKKTNYWGGADMAYYWPKNGSLRFACYSPTEIEGGTLTHNLANDKWDVKGYVQSSNTAETIDFMIAQTPASYTAATAEENVSVVFEHALSWITIKVKAQDKVAAEAFTINKVTINDVNTVANLAAEYPAKVWSDWATPKAYEVFAGEQKVTETAEVIDTVKTKAGTVVIPQATTTVTIDYVQNALEGTPALTDQQVTVSLALDAENTPWEPGKHYVYTIIFGLDEILINPSVVDWEEVVVENKNYDEFVYADVEVAAGEILTVATDAVIEGSLNVAGTLDGAGHTLTSAEVPTDNGMVRPTDGAVIKNVTIDGNNLSWDDNGTSRGLRGVYVNAGGTYTLDNVTIVNTTYAINVNTTQPVTLTVTNSTLQNWTSYGTSTTATFENVEFTAGNYKMFRPYGTTTMKNCAFEAGFEIDLGSQGADNSIVFEGCTYGGEALAEEHLTNATGKNFTIK